jgi:nucleotide-binding universal stress UspA family protein
MGVLSQNLYTMIVTMAVVTTMAMPPMLRWALSRLPMGDDEKARLEREEFEAKGFVANLDRLLLAVDDSANGKLASHLAGLLAGGRGSPTTILHIAKEAREPVKPQPGEKGAEAAVKAAAEQRAAAETEATTVPPTKVDVTTKAPKSENAEAIAREGRKGYGLMVVGLDQVAETDGAFAAEPARLAAAFDGPLAIAIARGDHLEDPALHDYRILVPITGTDVSRRAADVAVAIARATEAPVSALYVSTKTPGNGLNRFSSPSHRHEEAILKDIVALGERYDRPIRTSLKADIAPDEAILRKVRSGRHNLIVMGVNRRPGETLFFGNVAASVLQQAKVSILFISN